MSLPSYVCLGNGRPGYSGRRYHLLPATLFHAKLLRVVYRYHLLRAATACGRHSSFEFGQVYCITNLRLGLETRCSVLPSGRDSIRQSCIGPQAYTGPASCGANFRGDGYVPNPS